MDFKDSVNQISERIEKLKDSLHTEEATKNALIMPFIQALGYDVFNPLEVVPEFTCDIGTKKGEKIDYAIMMNDKPVILIECKHWEQDLNLYDNQLIRYFNVSDAKFGVITNGILYRFYTDIDEANKMDKKPFLEVNMLDLKDAQIEELKKFHKSYFDVDSILTTASDLKYLMALKNIIADEFSAPSPEFVKFLGKQVCDKPFTQSILDQFGELTKRAISSHLNDLISGRLKAAIKDAEAPAPQPEKEEEHTEEDNGIVTTEEELDGYNIVRAILGRIVDVDRVTYKDTASYFAVTIDGKTTKTVCRLRFNYRDIRRLSINHYPDPEENIDLTDGKISELYKYEDKILDAAKKYIENE